jgi:large subunit ribosomal protein L4
VVEDKNQDFKRAFSNLDNVKMIQSKYINTYDALNADHIVMTKAALDSVSEWLGGDK